MVTLDPYGAMRAKSRKVLLPPLVDKIGFIGNLKSFMIITPQVKAINYCAWSKAIVTRREAFACWVEGPS
jgi:hypothetical protein